MKNHTVSFQKSVRFRIFTPEKFTVVLYSKRYNEFVNKKNNTLEAKEMSNTLEAKKTGCINVTNEIKKLKKVLVHRPGDELLNLTPATLEELLFDDIPDLTKAQAEHDAFAEILRSNGAEVVYLEDLMAETLKANPELKEQFVDQYITESNIHTDKYHALIKKYLLDIKDEKELVLKTMSGIRLDEIVHNTKDSLVDMIESTSHLLTNPMPNLYFTRDPFASVGKGVTIHKMLTETRNRETIYCDYIFRYHPDYRGNVTDYYGRNNPFHIEGGDVLNLNKNTLAIGISQRTTADAIQELAEHVFFEFETDIKTILAIVIPSSRAFMHLDTVFTQIDTDAFTYHPGIMKTLEVFEITPNKADGSLNFTKHEGSLEEILAHYLGLEKVRLFPCGAGDPIAAEREQWTDGSNTLTIAPGRIVVYKRNTVTNQFLKDAGFDVIELDSDNLTVGRGGPRCMSMPLEREE